MADQLITTKFPVADAVALGYPQKKIVSGPVERKLDAALVAGSHLIYMKAWETGIPSAVLWQPMRRYVNSKNELPILRRRMGDVRPFDHGKKCVFLVPESDSSEVKQQKIALWFTEGIVSDGCRNITYEEWVKELEAARAKDCFCGLLYCCCDQVRDHDPNCRFRKAMVCPVAVECDHGHDVCPQCDRCTCGGKKEAHVVPAGPG